MVVQVCSVDEMAIGGVIDILVVEDGCRVSNWFIVI